LDHVVRPGAVGGLRAIVLTLGFIGALYRSSPDIALDEMVVIKLTVDLYFQTAAFE
jgi:hypothetical protein